MRYDYVFGLWKGFVPAGAGRNMKRREKYLFCQILLLLSLIGLAGCTGKKEEESGETYWILNGDMRTYGERGVFYQENGYLHFMDSVSGLDVTVCDKPECSHSRTECPAYFEGRVYGAFWEEDTLYLLTDYGADRFGELYLYEASVNGEDRKKAAELGEAQHVSYAVFTEKYIVFSYWNQYDENMKELPRDQIGVGLYDRRTGECRDILSREGWNARVYQLDLVDDEIYVSCFYYDLTAEEVLAHETDQDYMQQHLKQELVRSDVEGQDITSPLQGIPDMAEVQTVCEAGIFYNAGGRLYLLDAETGVSRDMGENMIGYPSFSEKGQLFGSYDSDTGEISFYLYGMGAEELRLTAKMRACIPTVVFEDVCYAYDYHTDNGNGVLAFCRTGDFLNGKTDGFTRFEK